MALEKEMAAYERMLPALLDQQGSFVVIAGDQNLGTYDSYADALKIGYEKNGLTPFLVKKIESTELAQYFGRDIGVACHT